MSFLTEQIHFRELQSLNSGPKNRMIVWVGAGLSAQAGLPTWSELESRLIVACKNDIVYHNPENRNALNKRLDTTKRLPDPWDRFTVYKNILREQAFAASIREEFSDERKLRIPESFVRLWALNIQGVITTNIDDFAQRAYAKYFDNAHSPVIEVGLSVGERLSILGDINPFIVHIHGHVHNPKTWIFTKEERDALNESEGYKRFIQNVLMNNQNLFLGVSLEDESLL